MKIVRQQPPETNHKFVLEKEKGIFVITPKMLVSLDKIGFDKTKAYWFNVPLGLIKYAKENKFTVILLTERGDVTFLWNPNNYKLIDIDLEFHRFLKENYDKI